MERPALDWPTERTIGALETIAAELERLRLLKEYELAARIEHAGGDPYVKPDDKPEPTEEQ
jgi:hypothetical protein